MLDQNLTRRLKGVDIPDISDIPDIPVIPAEKFVHDVKIKPTNLAAEKPVEEKVSEIRMFVDIVIYFVCFLKSFACVAYSCKCYSDSYCCVHDTTPQPFYSPFSGTTQVSRCHKRTSGLYGAWKD